MPASRTLPQASPADRDDAVVNALLDFGDALRAQLADGVRLADTDHANRLLAEDPFAFLLGVLFDQGIPAPRAWAAPSGLRDRIGHLDPRRIAQDPSAVLAAVRTAPALHRYTATMGEWVVDAARRVLDVYGGDAGRIWGDAPTAVELQQRLRAFRGIGQKKAAMAVEVLVLQLGVEVRDLHGSDVAADVHVRRVFRRSGLADSDEPSLVVAAARAAHPERPGLLNLPAWSVGRLWCRPTSPSCDACALAVPCPRLVGPGGAAPS